MPKQSKDQKPSKRGGRVSSSVPGAEADGGIAHGPISPISGDASRTTVEMTPGRGGKSPKRKRHRFWWTRQRDITGPIPVVTVSAVPAVSRNGFQAPDAFNVASALDQQLAALTGKGGPSSRMLPPTRRKLQAKPRTVGEVQRTYVSARTIVGSLLCVRPQGAAATSVPGSQDSYCAILEVSPINFLLRSKEEQDDIVAGFGEWLNSLQFPVQVLVQVRQLDLGPYVSRLQAAVNARVESFDVVGGDHAIQKRWIKVASDHVDFVLGLARKKMLLERHFYVVLSFDGETSSAIVGESIAQQIGRRFSRRYSPDLAALPRSRFGRGSKQDRGLSESLRAWQRQASAQQQLDLRVTEMTRSFERLGLEVRQLQGGELATIYYRALTPERAIQHPLGESVIAGLDLPIESGLTSPGDSSYFPASEQQRQNLAVQGINGHGIPGAPAPTSQSLSPRQRDFASLADLLAPASVELAPDNLCLEGEYSRVLAVTAYPRQVFPGWLARIIDQDYLLDVALHIHPRDSRATLRTLRTHLAQYTASLGLDHRMGRMPDQQRRIAIEDVTRLADHIERGTTRVFDYGLYVRVYATRQGGLEQLHHRTEQVYGAFDHLQVVARPSLWEQDLGFASILPQGRDLLHRTRLFDTETVATAWPFSTSSISMSEGILFGLVPTNGSFVILDPFSPQFENANQVVFGVSGGGKSYATKLRVIRSLIAGISSVIVDPENEYQRLCFELGGQYIRLAPGSHQHINPFDLPTPAEWSSGIGIDGGPNLSGYLTEEDEDPLADKIQSLHALFDLLLAERGPGQPGTLSRGEKALLDQVIFTAYERAGITSDPRTHGKPAPLLRDVYDILANDPAFSSEDRTGLRSRLHRYISGALSRLFSAPTDVELDNPLVVFNIADLDEELRPLGLYLVSDCIWTHVRREQLAPRPRLLLVDEAWSLLQFPEGGRFLSSLVRRARKRFLGVVTISQDINDFLGSEWGQTILKNSATKLLMKQDSSSIDLITDTFKLSTGERRQLLSSEKGEGLLFALAARIAIRVEASPDEHALATTDPHDIEQLHAAMRQATTSTAARSVSPPPAAASQSTGVSQTPTSSTESARKASPRIPTRQITESFTEEYVRPEDLEPEDIEHHGDGINEVVSPPGLGSPWVPVDPSAFAQLQTAALSTDERDSTSSSDSLLYLPTRAFQRDSADADSNERSQEQYPTQDATRTPDGTTKVFVYRPPQEGGAGA